MRLQMHDPGLAIALSPTIALNTAAAAVAQR
jgi:hypothetical protein